MRRTKEDSERTRRRIIAAARQVFARQGVRRTTLEEVARAAGVTRGAIYWHFAGKTELFYAMREQVLLPTIDTGFAASAADAADPLGSAERFLRGVIASLDDPAARETFRIMGFKCEYVGELGRELDRQRSRCTELTGKLAQVYRRARRAGQLRPGLTPAPAASATCSFLIGLVRLWLMDKAHGPIRGAADTIIKSHIDSYRHNGR
ncbi:MAG TPA: TetR family transcriptional regulator [Burkholderiales bacterium]|nr:TetR family transcriptional regulator [Burkholderiales bacterium]